MNELNPPYVVAGSLPANEPIDMADVEPIPGSQAFRVEELVESVDKEFDLPAGVFRQSLVLLTKTQIVGNPGCDIQNGSSGSASVGFRGKV